MDSATAVTPAGIVTPEEVVVPAIGTLTVAPEPSGPVMLPILLAERVSRMRTGATGKKPLAGVVGWTGAASVSQIWMSATWPARKLLATPATWAEPTVNRLNVVGGLVASRLATSVPFAYKRSIPSPADPPPS